jgi:hypothetical protein
MAKLQPFYARTSWSTGTIRYPSQRATTPPVKNMPLGARMIRTAVFMGLAMMLTVILHAGMLYSRGSCQVSLDRAQDHIDLNHLELENRPKVDMYVTSH